MLANLEMVKALLDGAERVVVLTGSGVSAESGIPTFREADGLWRQFRAEELARPDAFAEDPELVWEFYNWRRELVANSEPNDAHLALADLECVVPEFLLITQNVDGLHSLAGSRNLLEMHGSLWELQCTMCSWRNEDRTMLSGVPSCPACGALLRPGVVWFGEALPPGVLNQAIRAIAEADVFLSVGTSAMVQPAASFAQLAREQGAVTVEINLEPTPNSGLVDFALHGKAGTILPRLTGALCA